VFLFDIRNFCFKHQPYKLKVTIFVY